MKLSEYITNLQGLLEAHGDLDVVGHRAGSGVLGAIREGASAELRHRAILSGREHTPRTFSKYVDASEKQGAQIVLVF